MSEHDLATEGTEAVRKLLESTSERLGALVQWHEQELMALADGTGDGAERLASERLRLVIGARHALTERASEIALRLEAMLDRLEAVEAELRSQIRPAREVAPSVPGSGDARNDELKERRRKRWWLRFFRRAA
jgi:hypothetical protein